MAFKLGDRCRETSTAPGSGSFTVNGAVQGAQSLASVLTSNGDTSLYGATNGTAWETGLMTRTSATVYARTTIYASSNSGSAVNFSSGTVDVFLDLPATFAESLRYAAQSGLIISWGANVATNPVWQIDFSTASVATGLKAKGAAAAGGVALSVVSSGSNESLTIDAKGTGSITFNGTATGQLLAGLNGTVSLPAWSFASDPDTGVYRIGANNLGISANGAKVLDIGTGGLGVTGTFTYSGVQSSTSPRSTNGTLQVSGGEGGGSFTSASIAFGFNATSNTYMHWIHTRHVGGSPAGNAIDFATSDGTANGTYPTNGVLGLSINGGAITFPGIGTTASAANAFIDNAASNNLLRSTSSLRYKTDVEPLDPKYADEIFNLTPIWYRSLAEADNPEWGWYGLGAEDVAKVDPRLVTWSYADDAYEIVDVEADVPAMEEFEQSVVTIEDGVAVRKAVVSRREKIAMIPVLHESGEPSMIMGPDEKPIPEMASVPVMQKGTRQERRLKAGAKKVPDSVQYDRIAVLLLSVVKRMRAKQ